MPNRRSLLLSTAAALALPTAPAHALDFDFDSDRAPDRRALLDGVTEIVAPSCLPGPLAVYGPEAFAVVAGKSGDTFAPMVAAARAGRGRVVVLGHEGFLSGPNRALPQNARFVANVLRWVSGEAAPREANRQDFTRALAARASGKPLCFAQTNTPIKCVRLDQDELSGAKPDVFVALQAWVRDGGGLIVAGPGWGWRQMHAGKTLTTNHSGNRLLSFVSIGFADGSLSPTGGDGWRIDAPERSFTLDDLNASSALGVLTGYAEGRVRLMAGALAQATQTVGTALSVLPDDTPFARRVQVLAARYGGDVLPRADAPVTSDQPFARLAILGKVRVMEANPEAVPALACAPDFPGAVSADAPRVARVLTLGTVPGWHSTGLYAPPGATVQVTVPASAAGRGLAIRIGAHTDDLTSLATWKRFPVASTRRELTGPITTLTNPLGGAVFLDVPAGTSKPVDVRIAGAVAAPLWVRGVTSREQWRTIRTAPGPWAELQGTHCILSVPSAVVRGLDDPDALMAYWDSVCDAAADLYAIPHARARQERYVADVQISAGYMHSGYPIMTGLDVAPTFVSLPVLTGADGLKAWGFYHELGHNHQKAAWTWDGCGEVTNNLFSLYACEQFNHSYQNNQYLTAHPAVRPDALQKRWSDYVARGKPYEDWKRDPFLALGTFIELRQGFGWEPFKKVFAEYEVAPASLLPRTDEEKRDQFMMRFSRAIGKNLGPFFADWGIPTSESARASVAALPSWVPQRNPLPVQEKA